MPGTAIYADGVDICDAYKLRVTALQGFWDGFAGQDQELAVPRRMGSILTAADQIIPPRDFGVSMVMRAASVSERRSLEDQLNALLYGKLIEVVGIDLTTRARYGRPQSLKITPVGPQLIATDAKLELQVHCQDPLAYELAPTMVAFAAVRTAIPAGSTPFSPRFVIANATAGTLSNFTLTQRNAVGDVVATMVLTGSLLTGEYLDLDNRMMSLSKVDAAGARTSARSWLTSGTYFVLRPGDSIEVDKGSGLSTHWKAYF